MYCYGMNKTERTGIVMASERMTLSEPMGPKPSV